MIVIHRKLLEVCTALLLYNLSDLTSRSRCICLRQTCSRLSVFKALYVSLDSLVGHNVPRNSAFSFLSSRASRIALTK